MMVFHVPHKNKSVVLLSSQHSGQAVCSAEHAKPDIILDDNKCKGALPTSVQVALGTVIGPLAQ